MFSRRLPSKLSDRRTGVRIGGRAQNLWDRIDFGVGGRVGIPYYFSNGPILFGVLCNMHKEIVRQNTLTEKAPEDGVLKTIIFLAWR